MKEPTGKQVKGQQN